MTPDDVKTASHCDHNFLWSCRHKDQHGIKCVGPCELMEIYGSQYDPNIICPTCNSPVESGYCVNKLCVNHG